MTRSEYGKRLLSFSTAFLFFCTQIGYANGPISTPTASGTQASTSIQTGTQTSGSTGTSTSGGTGLPTSDVFMGQDEALSSATQTGSATTSSVITYTSTSSSTSSYSSVATSPQTGTSSTTNSSTHSGTSHSTSVATGSSVSTGTTTSSATSTSTGTKTGTVTGTASSTGTKTGTATATGTSTNTSTPTTTSLTRTGTSTGSATATGTATTGSISTKSTTNNSKTTDIALNPYKVVEVKLEDGSQIRISFQNENTMLVEEMTMDLTNPGTYHVKQTILDVRQGVLQIFSHLNEEMASQILIQSQNPEAFVKKVSEILFKADGALREAFRDQIPAALLENVNRLLEFYGRMNDDSVTQSTGGSLHGFSRTAQAGSKELDDGPESDKDKQDQNGSLDTFLDNPLSPPDPS